MRYCTLAVALVAAVVGPAQSAELKYKQRLLPELVKQVPQLLKQYDARTGHFGSGIWISTDQNLMYPLAAAYATSGSGNRYYHDRALLEVVMKAGDALAADADAKGQWLFRKKDGSTWGMTRMCWAYSRWIRSFALIQSDMPPERRAAWAKALTLGYSLIAKHDLGSLVNIPTHHAMGLYAAGKALGRPEWCRQAADFLMRVVATQAEAGYWSEGGGPVVLYDFVYVDALGTYYALSGDRRALPALEKAARFHYDFTYPDGRCVETIDQRNPYHGLVERGNVGFSFSPIGRAYLARQWSKHTALDADLIASLLLFGEEGPAADAPRGGEASVATLKEQGVERAAAVRSGPWFFCLSAYTTPVSPSRWHQDRQNLVSIYHDRAGLIVGGGNTKLQPFWSTFSVGDPALLVHTPGDANPHFLPPPGKLFHVPTSAALVRDPDLGLDLTYGPEQCRVRLHPLDDHTLAYRLAATAHSGLPVAAHLTLLPQTGKTLQTGGGASLTIGPQPADLTAAKVGSLVTYAGYRLRLPPTATLHWPCFPHNPYTKDGHAGLNEARIAITIPFDDRHPEYTVTVKVGP
jgi:hypothetical protein